MPVRGDCRRELSLDHSDAEVAERHRSDINRELGLSDDYVQRWHKGEKLPMRTRWLAETDSGAERHEGMTGLRLIGALSLVAIGYLVGELPTDLRSGHPADSPTLIRPKARTYDDVQVAALPPISRIDTERLSSAIVSAAKASPNALIVIPDAPLHCCRDDVRARLAASTGTVGRLVLGWDPERRGSPWGVTGAIELPTLSLQTAPPGFLVCEKEEGGPALAQVVGNLATGMKPSTALPQCRHDPTWWGGGAAGVWAYRLGRAQGATGRSGKSLVPRSSARVIILADPNSGRHREIARQIGAIIHHDTMWLSDWPRLAALLVAIVVVAASRLRRWSGPRYVLVGLSVAAVGVCVENIAYRSGLAAAIGVPILVALAVGWLAGRPRSRGDSEPPFRSGVI